MRVLITGSGSYVGQNIKKWLEKDGHYIEELEVRSNKYKEFDYSGFDSIIHVAAIVHRAKDIISWETYQEVNALLPYEIASLAKKARVKQFIFLSTMAVYGQVKKLPSGNIVNENTSLDPQSYYGKSKLMAEKLLAELSENEFRIAIVRPPNIYGKDCPGNYIKSFERIVKVLPVAPYAFEECKQSFLYVDNLSELIRLIVIYCEKGLYFPQDNDQISTVELMRQIAEVNRINIKFSKLLGFWVKNLGKIRIVKKVYGGLTYNPSLSNHFNGSYRRFPFEKAIKLTLEEGNDNGRY